VIEGVIPADAPMGETALQLVADECGWSVGIMVLGSPLVAAINDDTVTPGQRVTVTAGGFAPSTPASLSIDSVPVQGECIPECHFLGRGTSASADGSVVFRERIPRDTRPGRHTLWVSGDSLDGITEYELSVEITVVAGGTLPPTDTE
jgi:hypothetical protein